MARIRTHAGHHRGWDERQQTPAAIARNIVASIRAKQAVGRAWAITEYTTQDETQRLVEALLSK